MQTKNVAHEVTGNAILGHSQSYSDDQLQTHLADFMAGYDIARRLKTIGGLTPYEYICRIWTSEPDQFNLNPIHQMLGLNTWR